MKAIKTDMPGVYLVENFHVSDLRGGFTKIFNEEEFLANGLQTVYKETFYSISNKNVIRGMHFQMPPFDHAKLVHIIKGKVLDVVLDLRKGSPTYGKATSFILEEEKAQSVYIPIGCAHGFKALEDNTIMLYDVASVHSKEHDAGVRWDSFGFDWECDNPIMTERDSNFVELKDFKSPF